MEYKSLQPLRVEAEEEKMQRIASVQAALIKHGKLNVASNQYPHLLMRGLGHYELLLYLEEHSINEEVAKEKCLQATFKIHNLDRCALAFRNEADGFVLQGPRVDGACGPQTVSWFHKDVLTTTCMKFNNFMDYLAFLTLIRNKDPAVSGKDGYDVVVLNGIDPELICVLDLLHLYKDVEVFCDAHPEGRKQFLSLRKIARSRTPEIPVEYTECSVQEYLEQQYPHELRRRRGRGL